MDFKYRMWYVSTRIMLTIYSLQCYLYKQMDQHPWTWRIWQFVCDYWVNPICKYLVTPGIRHLTPIVRWIKAILFPRQLNYEPNVIIAICGKKGSGKDTSTQKIRRHMWLLNCDYYKHRTFAYPLKATVKILTQCSDDKLNTHDGKESVFENKFSIEQETFRDILKSVGKATRRFLANWIDQTWKRETRLWNTKCRLPNRWVLSDLRLQEELKWLRTLENVRVFVIRVEHPRPSHLDSDITETSVDMFPPQQIDFTIHNIHWDDNQRNLDKQCEHICKQILYQLKSK